MRFFCKIAIFVLLFAAVEPCWSQHIGKLSIPRHVCAGDTVLITFGYDSTNNVVIVPAQHILGHRDRIFLPDGVSCGDMGCSYLSSVNFTDFNEDSTVTSVEAIKYLRLNIEHSYIADLYIRIECPNGQGATVMRFGGTATSQCSSLIPSSAMGWLDGYSNMPGERDFGIVGGGTGTPACDSTADGNAAGTGWNYCWSNNSVSGYIYHDLDGIIYRTGHSHNGFVDSSYVEEGVRFYHPDQNFSALIGCPLNGEWSIEVVDGFQSDNGYLFEWDLALDESLLAGNGCVIDSFVVEGYGASRINDTAFFFTVPYSLPNDTVISYYFRAFDDCGRSFDTMVNVTFHVIGYKFDTVNVPENDMPYTYRNTQFEDSVSDYRFVISSSDACDSILLFTLVVWPNSHTYVDTVICENELPFVWHDTLFTETDSMEIQTLSVHGADSLITYFLYTQKPDTNHVHANICRGVPFTWIDGIVYTDDSESPVYILPTNEVCDSIFQLHLHYNSEQYKVEVTVHPNPVPTENSRVVLRDISNSVARTWTFMSQTDTARQTGFYFPFPEDSVDVLCVGRDYYGCIDSTTITVFSDLSSFYAPNVFTPGEPTNNTFFIASNLVVEGKVSIFTRAGQLVATFDLLTGFWDGTFKGELCPQGVYVWEVIYTRRSMPKMQQHAIGTVTLLR